MAKNKAKPVEPEPEAPTKLPIGHRETVPAEEAAGAIALAKSVLPKGGALSVVHRTHSVTLTVVEA